MLKSTVLPSFMLGLIALSGCGNFKPPALNLTPLSSPVDTWSVQMSQSGGIAGVMLTVDVTSDGQLHAADQRSGRSVTRTLPPEAIAQLQQLVSGQMRSPGKPKSSACADCFIYALEVTSGAGSVRIRADDVTLNDSGAAALIAFLRNARDNALASQP